MLLEEDIRLLRVQWLLAQPKGYKIQRRQDLEKPENEDRGLSPLLTGKEAAALMHNGAREVGALSYGWLLPWALPSAHSRTRVRTTGSSTEPVTQEIVLIFLLAQWLGNWLKPRHESDELA